MRLRLASFVPWIGAVALVFAVACGGSAPGDGIGDGQAVPPGTPTASDPPPLNPDPDQPVDDSPIVEPGPGNRPPSDGSEPPPLPSDDVIEEPAPIVSLDLLVAESYPPQYFVAVTSAQPDGCHRFSRYEVTRNGTAIEIAVLNTVPKNLAVVLCAAIYGETETSVPLGSDFEPGVAYTISVNGEPLSFVAQ